MFQKNVEKNKKYTNLQFREIHKTSSNNNENKR